MTSQLSLSDPEQLLDYVNSVAAVSAYAAAVSQTQPPALTMTPPWYAGYIESYENVQARALTWTNGTLPELQKLPAALLDADGLLQPELTAAGSALSALAADPSDANLQQAAVAALSSLSTQAAPIQKALDDLQAEVTKFSDELTTDITTLTAMSESASKAAGSDAAEVAKLTTVIAQLQQAIETRQEIAHLENLLKGDLAIFLVVVAATVGWLGGPIVDGLLGMAAIGLLAGIGDKLASEPDIVALQAEITNVQQEISEVNAEVAILQATVSTFAQLAQQGTGTEGALVEISSTWAAQTQEVDSIAADLAAATGDVPAEQVAAAQLAVQNVGSLWSEVVAAMQILAGVSWQVSLAPVPVAASS